MNSCFLSFYFNFFNVISVACLRNRERVGSATDLWQFFFRIQFVYFEHQDLRHLLQDFSSKAFKNESNSRYIC